MTIRISQAAFDELLDEMESVELTKPEFGLSRRQEKFIDVERGLLGLMTIGNQPADQVDNTIDRTT
ncbi:MAG: hypothetical protein KME35_07425, partial [Aphanocapsa sp. GSE-SYN-MK-11-07L]|nr:hypothetical protein [Aphanocapsa sp. GSE-SYN-MK-11-07L]